MPYFECIKIKDITRKAYQKALINLKEQGLAEPTLEGIHCTGKIIFKIAVELGYIKIDPTQYAIIPKTQKTVEEIEAETEVPEYLEKEELSLLLKMARDDEITRRVYLHVTKTMKKEASQKFSELMRSPKKTFHC